MEEPPAATLEVVRLDAPARAVSTGRSLAVGDFVRVPAAGVGFGVSEMHMKSRGLAEWIATTSELGRQLGTLTWHGSDWRVLHLGGGGELWVNEQNIRNKPGVRSDGTRLVDGDVLALGVRKQIALRFAGG